MNFYTEDSEVTLKVKNQLNSSVPYLQNSCLGLVEVEDKVEIVQHRRLV